MSPNAAGQRPAKPGESGNTGFASTLCPCMSLHGSHLAWPTCGEERSARRLEAAGSGGRRGWRTSAVWPSRHCCCATNTICVRERAIEHSRDKLLAIPLRDAKHHEVLLDRTAVEVVERDVLRHLHGLGREAVVGLRGVEDDVPEVRRERRWLLGVPLRVLRIGTKVSIQVVVADAVLVVERAHARAELLLEVGQVNKVVDVAVWVRDGGLICGETPLVVDDELVRMTPLLQLTNVQEVIPGAAHGDLLGPPVESAGDVDVSAAPIPPKDHRHSIAAVELVHYVALHRLVAVGCLVPVVILAEGLLASVGRTVMAPWRVRRGARLRFAGMGGLHAGV
mmetsp:Transcript_13648/g.43621  ORF Transcript_13648/g.43621 Transcript_13648/m.43621 type:complete len:337 (+) Transcript_13648:1123-2133(+)